MGWACGVGPGTAFRCAGAFGATPRVLELMLVPPEGNKAQVS